MNNRDKGETAFSIWLSENAKYIKDGSYYYKGEYYTRADLRIIYDEIVISAIISQDK